LLGRGWRRLMVAAAVIAIGGRAPPVVCSRGRVLSGVSVGLAGRNPPPTYLIELRASRTIRTRPSVRAPGPIGTSVKHRRPGSRPRSSAGRSLAEWTSLPAQPCPTCSSSGSGALRGLRGAWRPLRKTGTAEPPREGGRWPLPGIPGTGGDWDDRGLLGGQGLFGRPVRESFLATNL